MRRNYMISFAFISLFAVGCSSSDPEESGDVLLEPPPGGAGVQFRMVTELESGAEVEHCRFFRAPPEGLNVNRDEVRFSKGSHHVLLYSTPYTEIPTADELGNPVDTSGVFDCSEGVTFNWQVSNLIAGSQNSTGESLIEFPDDVALKVPGNAVLLLNAHYLNTQNEKIEPEVAVNVHTIPDEQVKHEGGVLFWYNAFIKIDPSSSSTAKMSCPLPDDVTIGNAQSHMHRRGVGYEAVQIAPDGARTSIYANDRWENVPVTRYDGGLSIGAGSRIEYQCDYQNGEARTVWQGPRSSDEMCMFIASYWPARPEVSNCAPDPNAVQKTQNLNAEWIGSGTATCAETLLCVQQMPSGLGFRETIQELTNCVLAARPESSKAVSAGVRCLLTHDDPVQDCQAEIQACLNE